MHMCGTSFLLQCLRSGFLGPAVPDMFHSPLCVPLNVAMAVQTAMYPSRYGLANPTPTDQFACEDLR